MAFDVSIRLMLRSEAFKYNRLVLGIGQAKGLHFNPSLEEPVAMRIAPSAHYQLDDGDSAEEFAKLLPVGGHLIYLEDPNDPSIPPQPHSVMLFHPLKCLGIIREEYIAAREKPSSFTQHCLNYIRQTILYRPSLSKEPAWNSEGTAIRDYDAVCRDWTKVYEEAERNQRDYMALSTVDGVQL